MIEMHNMNRGLFDSVVDRAKDFAKIILYVAFIAYFAFATHFWWSFHNGKVAGAIANAESTAELNEQCKNSVLIMNRNIEALVIGLRDLNSPKVNRLLDNAMRRAK